MAADDFDQAIQLYLDYLKAERGLSANTVAAYTRDLRRYAQYLRELGLDRVRQIKAASAVGFPVALTEQGLSLATVGRMTVAIRGLHRFWAETGLMADDPADRVVPPTPGRHLPKALTVAEIEQLISATGGRGSSASAEQLADQALVELLYGTGARVSEILALNVDDATRMLAEADGELALVGKGRKTRLVPVGCYAREALQAWLVRGRPQLAPRAVQACPALFLNARGRRLSRQSVFNRIEAIGRRAGLAQPVSPHTLRHSYATHLLDGGADVRVVQELLGHASVATTQIYTLVTVEHLREVYRESHPRAL